MGFECSVIRKALRRNGEGRIVAVGFVNDIAIVVVYVMRGKSGGLFQRGEHIVMSGRITKTTSRTPGKGKTDFERLREMRDEDIDFCDIAKLNDSFWKDARLRLPELKGGLTIRMSEEFLR